MTSQCILSTILPANILIIRAVLCLLLSTTTVMATAQDIQVEVATTQEDDRFGGFGLSGGLLFTDSLRESIVNPNNVTVDPITRRLLVTSYDNVAANMVLVSHMTFPITQSVALGPAVWITPGSDQLLNSAGLGILFELSADGLPGFNIAVGGDVRFNVDILKSGLRDGFEVPAHITTYTENRELFVFAMMITRGFSF